MWLAKSVEADKNNEIIVIVVIIVVYVYKFEQWHIC